MSKNSTTFELLTKVSNAHSEDILVLVVQFKAKYISIDIPKTSTLIRCMFVCVYQVDEQNIIKIIGPLYYSRIGIALHQINHKLV